MSRKYLDDPDDLAPSFGMAQGDSQRLLIVVHATDDKRHLWSIDIPVIYAGRREVLEVRNAGRSPFITYGGRGLPVNMLVDGEWVESAPPPF